jgi:hypothetical protein
VNGSAPPCLRAVRDALRRAVHLRGAAHLRARCRQPTCHRPAGGPAAGGLRRGKPPCGPPARGLVPWRAPCVAAYRMALAGREQASAAAQPSWGHPPCRDGFQTNLQPGRAAEHNVAAVAGAASACAASACAGRPASSSCTIAAPDGIIRETAVVESTGSLLGWASVFALGGGRPAAYCCQSESTHSVGRLSVVTSVLARSADVVRTSALASARPKLR